MPRLPRPSLQNSKWLAPTWYYISLYKVEGGHRTKKPTPSRVNGQAKNHSLKFKLERSLKKKPLKFHLIFPTQFELVQETLNFRETASVQANPNHPFTLDGKVKDLIRTYLTDNVNVFIQGKTPPEYFAKPLTIG